MTSGSLQIKVTHDQASKFKSSGTALTFENFSVQMYQINKDGGSLTLFPIGIHLKSYGEDKASYIDVYGGTSTTPSARLGLLNNLNLTVNNHATTGFGLYTSNGYFSGTLVSTNGTIGNFTLGNDLRSGTWGTSNSVLVSGGYTPSVTDSVSIGGSPVSGNTWAFTAGNRFGVTTDGTLYASNGVFSGKITATSGTIGGFDISQDYLMTKALYQSYPYYYTSGIGRNVSVGDQNNVVFWSGLLTIDADPEDDEEYSIDPDDVGPRFYVTSNGGLYASNANITGSIHASSGSTFGDLNASYILMDGNSFEMYYGNEASPYVYFADLRDPTFYNFATITDTFISDGTTAMYQPSKYVSEARDILSVNVNGQEKTENVDYHIYYMATLGRYIGFDNIPSEGSVIEIKF